MRGAAAELDAAVEDVAHLLVDDAIGQPELGDLRAHHAAGLRVAVENDAFVAERREIARDGQRCGTGADERDALAVRRARRLRQPRRGCLPCSRPRRASAGRSRPARALPRLSGARASLPRRGRDGTRARTVDRTCVRESREDVRFPVDEVRVAIAPCGDQADVLGNRCVGRTCPLTIDDFVEIVGMSRYPSVSIRLLVTARRGRFWLFPVRSQRPGDGDRYRRMMLRQPDEQEKRRECNQLKQVDFLQQSPFADARGAALRYARMPFGASPSPPVGRASQSLHECTRASTDPADAVLARRRLRLQDRTRRAPRRSWTTRRICRFPTRCWSASRRRTMPPSIDSTTARRSSRQPTSSRRSSTTRSTSGQLPLRTHCPTSMRWEVRRSLRWRIVGMPVDDAATRGDPAHPGWRRSRSAPKPAFPWPAATRSTPSNRSTASSRSAWSIPSG